MLLNLKEFNNLSEALMQRASDWPQRTVFVEVKSNLQQIRSCTFQQLKQRILHIASQIQHENPPDCRAVLLLNNDLSFIESFWACLYKGVIAVPLYPPQGHKQLDRILNVIEDCQSTMILTTSTIKKEFLDPLFAEGLLPLLNTVCVDTLPESGPVCGDFPPSPATRQSIALLQYTSGSSGKPKGVILTHENVLTNAQMLIQGYNYDSEDRPLCWMPFYHDLGLMGGVLAPVLSGACTYITDARLIVRPIRLLQAISHYRITTTAAPNFVINRILQLTQPQDFKDLDLSTLKLVISGAEPISATSLRQLIELLKPHGFKSECLAPSYGLAESTVLSTTSIGSNFQTKWIKDQGLKREIVSCGHAILDEKIIIIDPESGSTLNNNHIGEICISGKHMTQGYWNKPLDNAKLFIQQKEVTYLKTRDLGFLDENHHLYIVGRLKDMMIIRGKKYHAVDIEHSILQTLNNESLTMSREATVCAFQMEDELNESKIVILVAGLTFAEPGGGDALKKKINDKLREKFEICDFEIHLSGSAEIRKTSSGKVRRQETQRIFLENKGLTHILS